MPMMIRVSIAAAALALTGLAAAAQAPGAGGNPNAVQGPERQAMERCVSQVLLKLRRAGASYREVPPTVAKDCDTQLRAVLGAAIRQGAAGPCTSVEGCIDAARNQAGEQASRTYQNTAMSR